MNNLKKQNLKFSASAFLLVLFTACSQSLSKITSVEFVPVKYDIILKNSKSVVENSIIAVSYNEHYNEAVLPPAFKKEYRTDTISYKSKMAVEFFLGNQNIYNQVTVESILENRDKIKIYLSAIENEDTSEYYQPFVIAKMHKARKEVEFYLNNEKIDINFKRTYVQ